MKQKITGYCPKCGNQVLFAHDATLASVIPPHLVFSTKRKKNRKVCVGGNTFKEALLRKVEDLSKENVWWNPEDSAYGEAIQRVLARLRIG